jgi:hypothetical protein
MAADAAAENPSVDGPPGVSTRVERSGDGQAGENITAYYRIQVSSW